ncbi:cytochrome B [Corynebacterium sp. 4HC-13]|uniref:aa3-type cytochrome oxidase subunit II n=1 Tax=Corynebacterium anserum TaxID=2684406 RepID=UPI001639DFAA|nr:cytochrome c oxidase subunit II [Corynebacterium anserum]MBC2680946.1 cytochrome B [Corynebacterium anserum]
MEQRKVHGLTRRLGLSGLLGASAMALTGCTVTPPDNAFFNALRMGWPKGITPEAHDTGNFWVWTWVAAWIIGIIMWVLMFVVIFRDSDKAHARRGNKDEFPRQTGYNVPLELGLTTVPVLIIMALFFFNVQVQDKATALDKDPQVKVDVTAFQWNWKFGYSEIKAGLSPNGKDYEGIDEKAQEAAEKTKYEDGEHGPIHGKSKGDLSYLHYNKIETVGSTEEIPVLVLPSHTAIQFDLASADVVHSFWVPEFLFKRDAFPHPAENRSERLFQIEEIQEEGAFVGRCAEMCGTYHAMMNFEVRVVSPEKFKQYIEFRQKNPQAPNSEALKSIGEDPYATSTKPFVSDRKGSRDGQTVERSDA